MCYPKIKLNENQISRYGYNRYWHLLAFLICWLIYADAHATIPTNIFSADCEEACIDVSDSASMMPTTGPVSLRYATYYGQAINNVFHDVVVDNDGNIYAFGASINQGFDAILVKFDKNGMLLWEEFIGGSNAENSNPNDNEEYGAVALDTAGNIYITGITNSNNFPTINAFQNNKSGGIDAFVAKYDPTGTLLLSSYLGGAGDENINGAGGIAVGSSGDIYICGSTTSTNFFNTAGAAQANFSGGTNTDGFVVKIADDFSTVEGTYWGELDEEDILNSLAVSDDGTVWAVGYATNSSLILNGAQANSAGDRDGIILSWDSNLDSFNSGTFIGGQFDEEINDLSIDSNGDILVTGSTFSTNDFPTQGGFQNNYVGGQEAFVIKLDATAQIIWSTFLGGTQNENGLSINTDQNDDIYVSGFTSSDDFPISRTVQETYNTLNCEQDAFVFKFKNNGSRDWASYYGGWRQENSYGIAINNDAQVIIVGSTESTDLPTTSDAHQFDASVAGKNAFMAILEIMCPSRPIAIHSVENAIYYDNFWCNSYTRDRNHHFAEDTCAMFLIGPPGYTEYQWSRGNAVQETSPNRFFTISDPGSQGRDYGMRILDGNDCNMLSEAKNVFVGWLRPMCGFGSLDEDELPHPATILEGTETVSLCPGETVNFEMNADGFCGALFQWQKDFEDIPGEIGPSYTATEPGCYRIGIQNSFTGCTVYSVTKKFVELSSVTLNASNVDRDLICDPQDEADDCEDLRIVARVPNCNDCISRVTGITYTFFRDGVQVLQNSSGSYTANQSGNYHVEISNGNCSYVSNEMQVSIQDTEPPIWTQPTQSICIYDKDSLQFDLSHPALSDSATVRYYFPAPVGNFVSMDSTVVINELGAGCAFAILTTKNGCSSRSANIELHDTLRPIMEPNGPLCLPVRLYGEDLSSCGLDSMIWYLNGVEVDRAGYETYHTAREPGDYYIVVKNACGEFASDTLTIRGDLDPGTISPEGPLCLPASLTIDIPEPSENIIPIWYRQDGESGCRRTNSNRIDGVHDLTIIANEAGFYFATLQDTITGCTSGCSNKVEIQTSVAGANINPSNDIYFCEGMGPTNVQLSISPANSTFSYQWYRNSDPIAGATNSTYNAIEEGVYRAYIENSCDDTFTPVISIYNIENPELTINAPDTIYLCGPDTIRLASQADQPLLYTWFQNGNEIMDEVDSVYLATAPGVYQVNGINNGTQCEDQSQIIEIISSTTIITDVVVSPSCNGACSGALAANISGGVPFDNGSYLYLWSNGETTSTINDLCEGEYSLTISDKTGCNTSIMREITRGFEVDLEVDSVSCFGGQDGQIRSTITGGQSPFEFEWSNGETTTSVEDLLADTYSVTITDDFDCSTIADAIVDSPDALSISLSSTPVTCTGSADGSISAVLNGGSTPYQLDWSSEVVLDSNMLVTGRYYLTLTDDNQCMLMDSVDVGEPNLLEVQINVISTVLCAAADDASIEAIITGGTAPYDIEWEDGSDLSQRDNLGSGTYRLTITDQNNCQDSTNIVIGGMDAIAFDFEVENISCTGVMDGSISFSPSGGTTPYTYYINSAQSSIENAFENLGSADYQLQIEDANGCLSSVIDTTITEPDALIHTLTAEDESCAGMNDGSISLTVAGGIEPYQIEWSSPVDLDENNLPAGMYRLTITDQNNCVILDSIVISEKLPLVVDIVVVDSLLCHADRNGHLEVQYAGGTPPLTLAWSTGDNTDNIENLGGGEYTISVTDANDCQKSISYTMLEPELIDFQFDLKDVSCHQADDGEITFIVNGGTAPFSYLLNGRSMSDSIMGNLTPDNYQLQVEDANGCLTASIDTMITEPTALTNQLTAISVSCAGRNDGSISLTISGGTEPYQLDWSSPVTLDSESLAAGWYYLSLTDANNCSLIDSVEITTVNPMVTEIDQTEILLCHGDANGQLASTINGGTAPYTYAWSNGGMEDEIENLLAGTYGVTVTDVNGCRAESTYDILQPPLLGFSSMQEDIKCFGMEEGSIQVSTTGGTGPLTFTLNNTSQADSLFSDLAPGRYMLQIEDANACLSEDREILIADIDRIQIQLNAAMVSCFGAADGLISIQVTGGNSPYNYAWSSPVTTDSTMLSPGNYGVTITDANDCTSSSDINITEPEMLESEVNQTQEILCYGDESGSLEAVANGGTAPYRYVWSTSAETDIINNAAAGYYTVTVSDQNECLSISNYEIGQPDSLILDVRTTEVICFGDNNGSIAFDANGGTLPYQYFVNDVLMVDSIFTDLFAGDYEVYMLDASNCRTATITVQIDTPEEIMATVLTTDVICSGTSTGTASVDVTGGVGEYNFAWSNGRLSDIENQLAAGSYQVSIMDMRECLLVAEVIIGEPDVLSTTLSQVDNLCYADSTGMIRIENTVGGTPPYLYYLHDNLISNNRSELEDLKAGSYIIKTVDAQDCEQVIEIFIEEPPLMVASLGADMDIIFGEQNNLNLEVTNSGPNVLIEWIPDTFLDCDALSLDVCFTPEILLPLYSLEYEVIITDENGCLASDDIIVNVERLKNPVYMPNAFSPNADGVNDKFFVQSHISVGKVISFQIFDRWGILAFSESDFMPNDPAYGWDGIQDGAPRDPDTYIYQVEYELLDGERHTIGGSLVLMR